jgi:hypothetical protein
MSRKDESITRRALRDAVSGAPDDPSPLVAAVPALMREAARRRRAEAGDTRSFETFAAWALPRLAAATVFAVIASTTFVVWERGRSTATSLESVILGPDADVDVVVDLVGNDG